MCKIQNRNDNEKAQGDWIKIENHLKENLPKTKDNKKGEIKNKVNYNIEHKMILT